MSEFIRPFGKEEVPAFQELAREVATAKGIPQHVLLGLIEHESAGWNPNAKNPKSTATGMGQHLDRTLVNMGYQPQRDAQGRLLPTDPRLNPKLSIELTADHLLEKYARTRNWENAVRTYGENTDAYWAAVSPKIQKWEKAGRPQPEQVQVKPGDFLRPFSEAEAQPKTGDFLRPLAAVAPAQPPSAAEVARLGQPGGPLAPQTLSPEEASQVFTPEPSDQTKLRLAAMAQQYQRGALGRDLMGAAGRIGEEVTGTARLAGPVHGYDPGPETAESGDFGRGLGQGALSGATMGLLQPHAPQSEREAMGQQVGGFAGAAVPIGGIAGVVRAGAKELAPSLLKTFWGRTLTSGTTGGVYGAGEQLASDLGKGELSDKTFFNMLSKGGQDALLFAGFHLGLEGAAAAAGLGRAWAENLAEGYRKAKTSKTVEGMTQEEILGEIDSLVTQGRSKEFGELARKSPKFREAMKEFNLQSFRTSQGAPPAAAAPEAMPGPVEAGRGLVPFVPGQQMAPPPPPPVMPRPAVEPRTVPGAVLPAQVAPVAPGLPPEVHAFREKYGTLRGEALPREGVVSETPKPEPLPEMPSAFAKKKAREYNLAKADEQGDLATIIKAYGGFSSRSDILKNFEIEERRQFFPFARKGAQGVDALLDELKNAYPHHFGKFETDADLLRAISSKEVYEKFDIDALAKENGEYEAEIERQARAEGLSSEALAAIEADVAREIEVERHDLPGKGGAGATGALEDDFFSFQAPIPKKDLIRQKIADIKEDYPGIDEAKARKVIKALPNANPSEIALLSQDDALFNQVAKGNLSATERQQLYKNYQQEQTALPGLGGGGLFDQTAKPATGFKKIPLSEKGAIGFDIRPPRPPKDPDLVAAQEKVASRISRGEHEKKPSVTGEQVYTSLVDRLHPLKKMMDRLPGNKVPVSITRDPYRQARLFEGWHGKAEAFLLHHPFNRLTMQFERDKKPLQAILRPLEEEGKLGDFSDYLVARRSLERTGRGFRTGVDQDAARTVVSKLHGEMSGSAREYDAYNDALMRYTRDAGIISEDQYQVIKQGSSDYAPMMRVFSPEKKGGGGGKGFEAAQVVKAFKGSERQVVDPLESTVKLTYAMVNAAERNLVGRSIVDWANATGAMGDIVKPVPKKMIPTDVTWQEIIKDPEARASLKEHGITEDTFSVFRPSAFRPAPNVIAVWENGKRKFYEVPPDVAEVIRGMDHQTTEMWLRIMSGPAQAFRLGATTLSPEFGLRNFFKDQFPAFIQSKYGYKPMIDFMKGIVEMARGGEDYWRYMISGAPASALVSMDRRMLQQKLDDIVAGRQSMPGFILRHPIEAMKVLSEYSEMGTRLGEFTRGVQQEGATAEGIQESGFAAREITTDFGRRGASTKALNMLTAFWNANIQGGNKFIRTHRKNPWATMAKAAAAITIPAVLLELAYHNDPRYKNLPWWRRDLFYNIPSPVGVLSIPKPWTYGLVYGSIPQRLVSSILNQDGHAFDGLLKAVMREIPDFPLPTAVKPFLEALSNYNFFFDRPIVPRWKENLPPKFRYAPWTSETAKHVGNLLSKIPVINDTAMASPAVIDHFVMSWTGGAGRLALNALDNGLRASSLSHDIPRPRRVLADYPLVRAFVARYPSSDAEPVRRFYEESDRILAKQKAFKEQAKTLALQGRGGEIQGLMDEMGPDAFLKLQKARQALANIHKFIDIIQKHPGMTPDEKRAAIDKQYLSAINLAEKLNSTIDKVKNKKFHR